MKIPEYILKIIEKLEKNNFEVFIVGGCVRDLLIEGDNIPKDWDLTTNALPEEMLKIFDDGKYENNFGTVILPIKDKEGKTEHVVEITTYRSEQGYSDRRRPDEVVFEKEVDKDLSRRDFTINALAMKISDTKVAIHDELRKYVIEKNGFSILDLFGGVKDVDKKIIRAVGEPTDRFKEDALRMMRAIRFVSQLGFTLEPKTERSIKKMAHSIKFIAKERIGEEFKKIINSNDPYNGITALYDTGLLNYIIPELLYGVDVAQNHHHTDTVFKHNLLSLKYCPSKDWRVRMAALFHDIGKAKTRRKIDGQVTFYNHEYVSERMTNKIMKRLKFSSADIKKVSNLVRNHMFYYNVGEVTESSVRRLIKKTGRENLKDLIDLRIADRLGSKVKKAKPYKLRHLEYMMDKVQNDPVSVKMLKINGNDLIKELKLKPSPKIGIILDVLLSEVIEDPKLNTKDYLLSKSRELEKISSAELRKQAKEVIEEKRYKDDKKMKASHFVK